MSNDYFGDFEYVQFRDPVRVGLLRRGYLRLGEDKVEWIQARGIGVRIRFEDEADIPGIIVPWSNILFAVEEVDE